ncbi:PepSY domain-containing protein [Shewanella colwelliana]|uniref:PepSY domain-containing protein n=1 Tax=Shewanella colwelliana TaxID=23 RepID=UPI0022AF20EC|nr:PepSY domain-containing protein [Shewanella colwelliana]MCZ4337846.1 PepSY domain-containing protein [Shewanella colwelliana]
MMSMQTLHRWLAVIVGLQLLIWVATGLAFNLIDSQYLNGNHYRQKMTVTPIDTASPLAEPSRLLQQFPTQTVSAIALDNVLGKALYRVTSDKGKFGFWATDLSPVKLEPEQLKLLALSSYSGSGQIISIELANDVADKYSASSALYRVDLQDERNTHIYVDATTAEVVAHENWGSNLKQLLFMLHFMDYLPDNGVSFNHIVIRILATIVLLLGISGTILVIRKLKRGQYRIGRSHTENNTLVLLSPDNEQLETITIHHSGMLDALNHHKERIRTTCGGGGQCGLCRITFINNPPLATDQDKEKLKKEQLDAGMRLSCQHEAIGGSVSLVNSAQLRHYRKQSSILDKQSA